MINRINISLTPEEACDKEKIIQAIKRNIKLKDVSFINIIKRSVDGRGKRVKVHLDIEIFIGEAPLNDKKEPNYKDVRNGKEVIIIGAGPAGLFAALKLIEGGAKPIIFERGKNVSDRKRDIALLNREHKINPDSNYCFGEGGAGTFSDGKLYTRSNKKGDAGKIIDILISHGADNRIKYESRPHIGSDKLPSVIRSISKTITDAGGEIHFNSKLTDLVIDNSKIKNIEINNNLKIDCNKLILATGNSARDIYRLLYKKKIVQEFKPFALGVRVEHPQSLINKLIYHEDAENPFLEAASYSLATQVAGRGVYSFCMCPGGQIVAAATSDEEVVVNGMSSSLRNSPYANSGIVVPVEFNDLKEYGKYGPMAGIDFQKNIENKCYNLTGRAIIAPAQRLTDFIAGKASVSLPKCSYIPGIKETNMSNIFPDYITKSLQKGFKDFDRKLRGFITEEAIILGTESRTSSPVKIPRNSDTLEHISINGLYPCGEGAGYAGGIISSAIDGERCAESILK
ncbi:MAG: NAD(P)/FAD-dependent oxidoreductase [Bacteroidota bacterium]|nr:NAD(P)/FAD-dependent oxidoreductase [Bacteroidota bacterium]